MVGLPLDCIALELGLSLDYTPINEGFFPHGFGGLSLLKVFSPSPNIQVARRVMLSCICAQLIRIQVRDRGLLPSTTQESTFNSNAPHFVLLTYQLGNPCLLSSGTSLPLVFLQTLSRFYNTLLSSKGP